MEHLEWSRRALDALQLSRDLVQDGCVNIRNRAGGLVYVIADTDGDIHTVTINTPPEERELT